jgi:hypothetical protein
MKILVSIISSSKFVEDRIKYIEETWLKDVDDYLIISDEENKQKKIIKITDDSTYESNVIKNFETLKFLFTQKSDYDWYIVLDDDTFLNYKNLVSYLSTQSTEDISIIGRINWGTLPSNPSLNYMSGGAGYCFNYNTLKILKNINNEYNISRFADANIGFYCDKNNIRLNECLLFNPREPEYFSYNIEQIKKQITFHYIFKEKFYEIKNLIK